MAIYPVQSNYIIDVDIITTTSFKAGMALIRDDNGRAIPADSQQLVFKTIAQKSGKFLGFAASDHDSSGFTIIEPDVISASWLDNNRNFQRFENLEVSHVRRAIPEHLDPNYVRDNPTYNPIVYKRGIGVYNQQGEIYITDQFNPVLHGDYGFDGLDIQTINPGDLLTFGGGVNAGKLVKINANSFGPDVLVVAIVEKYIPQTGLLHFRQVNYSVSFGTNPYVLSIDPANTSSFVDGSITTTNLVTGTTGGTLVNGVSYSSVNSGAWVFDGSNDYINTSFNASLFTTNATILMWIQLDSNTPNSGQTGLLGFRPSFAGYTHYPWTDTTGYFSTFRTSRVNGVILSPLDKSTIHLLAITTDNTDWKLYQNTTLINTSAATTLNLSEPFIGFSEAGGSYNYKGKIFQFNLFNQALTATQITNYYNATKSRYGL